MQRQIENEAIQRALSNRKRDRRPDTTRQDPEGRRRRVRRQEKQLEGRTGD